MYLHVYLHVYVLESRGDVADAGVTNTLYYTINTINSAWVWRMSERTRGTGRLIRLVRPNSQARSRIGKSNFPSSAYHSQGRVPYSVDAQYAIGDGHTYNTYIQ